MFTESKVLAQTSITTNFYKNKYSPTFTMLTVPVFRIKVMTVEVAITNKPYKSQEVQNFALVSITFISFADGIEMFLPAVITQPISCDLGITPAQEHAVALSFYVSLAVMSIVSIPISNKIGRRTLLLVAMYVGIIITVLCSIVSNYIFLLLSRILLGIAVALNLATSGVYMAEISYTKSFFTLSLTAMATAYSLGGGWCGLLGYFLLDKVGWRYFILLTSLPIFIPPLCFLQFYLPETLRKAPNTCEETPLLENIPALTEKIPLLKSVIIRVTKLTFYLLTLNFVYVGDVLLIPAIMKDRNKESDVIEAPCYAIHGTQFLAITGLFGACHIVGRFLNYLVQDLLSTGHIFTVCSIICLPFTILCRMFPYNNAVLFTSLTVIQIVTSMAANESYICINDKQFFSQKYIASAAGFLMCVIALTNLMTSFVSEIVDYEKTLLIHVVYSLLNCLISPLFLLKD